MPPAMTAGIIGGKATNNTSNTSNITHPYGLSFIFFSFIAIFGQKHFEARESFYIKMKALYAYTIFDHNVLHGYW